MKRALQALASTAAAFAVMAAPAQADYYIGRGMAERFAAYDAADRYGSDGDYSAMCRPQGARAPEAGYIYHRWVCFWQDDYGCEGVLLISGSSRGRTWYSSRVMRGQRCP